jgi:hypothetical protein
MAPTSLHGGRRRFLQGLAIGAAAFFVSGLFAEELVVAQAQ